MVQVRMSDGILEGEEVVNDYDSGRMFFSFKGVPYAEPPLGDLRFKVRTTSINRMLLTLVFYLLLTRCASRLHYIKIMRNSPLFLRNF